MQGFSTGSAAALLFLVIAIGVFRQIGWWIVRSLSGPAKNFSRRAPDRDGSSASHSPRAMRLIDARLAAGRFGGLPLTLMTSAAAFLALVLGGLVAAMLTTQWPGALDHGINAFLGRYRDGASVAVLAWFTALGGSPCLAALTVITAGFLKLCRQGYAILPLCVSVIGSLAVTYLCKFLIARPRPDFVTDVTALTPSFPSGHATGAMAVYGFIAYVLARERPAARQRFEIAYWAFAVIALIGFSRLFLSVHYASDVAAGYLVGGFWLLVGIAIAEYRRQAQCTPRSF